MAGEAQRCGPWALPKASGLSFSLLSVPQPLLHSCSDEAEVEWFYEDLQDLLELTPKTYVLFIVRDWNPKVESQEPGITGKFSLGIQNEAGQRITEFCQETTLVIANTLFQ